LVIIVRTPVGPTIHLEGVMRNHSEWDFDSVLDDVAAMVRDRGAVTRAEIMEAFGLNDEDYAVLRARLTKFRDIKAGPKKRGGFELAVSRREAPPPEARSDEFAGLGEWEEEAVGRLCELFQHRHLEEMLGGLVHTIREFRRHHTAQDRRGTKTELATALVVQHGTGLLGDPTIRKRIARAADVDYPGRWHPGKAAAVAFARDAGFSPEFAGVPATDSRVDFEILRGRIELKALQRFQQEVQRKLLTRLYVPGQRALVSLPTGAGKTRVAVESIRYWLLERYDPTRAKALQGLCLWLAHTDELCEQAYLAFRQVWESDIQRSPLLLVRFWGNHSRRHETVEEITHQSRRIPSVVISTPQRIVNMIRGADESGQDTFLELASVTGLVVIDEAHRAAARSYREIVGTLSDLEASVSLAGLTATPFRMEYFHEDPEAGTRELREIFHELIDARETLGDDQRVALQEMGILARPGFETLETSTALRIPGFSEGEDTDNARIEHIDRILATRTDRTPRRLLIHRRLVEVARQDSSSILYFGPSVRDAECMAYMLRSSGIPSAVVTGRTRDAVRREVIGDFKDGTLKVLCNCEVLTTGFDAPRVSHVFMARPTVSQVLYEQMVGRGLRGPKFGGTATCSIVDCKDDIRGPRPELGYEAFRRVWG
jgi:DNA repair protein RadD